MTPTRPKHVLVVSSGWPTAGSPGLSVFVAHEVASLRGRGVDVEVVTYDGRMNPRNYLRARRRLRGELKRGRYDLVHAHFGQSALVALGCGVPLVITFHGSDLFGVIGRSGRQTMKGRALRAISRYAARRADRVVLAGGRLAEQLPKGVGYDVVPAGIDDDVFSPGAKEEARRELGLAPDARLILFSGSPRVPGKRFRLASEAVDLIRPRLDCQLIALDGEPRERVASYMRACDALLVTSTHESGPLMVKEALATNLRVVSVDVGDVPELIAGLPGCVLCADDRPDTIAGALESSLRSAAVFDGQAKAAELAQGRSTDRLLAVYGAVVSGALRSNASAAST